MRRTLKGMDNSVTNGDFLKIRMDPPPFPEAWLQIGGNYETRWSFGCESTDSHLEVSNPTAFRAGIIQAQEASLNVENEKEWLLSIFFKLHGTAETYAYLRLYPILSNGEVTKPWEYCIKATHEQPVQYEQYEQFKQVISIGANINSLRIETGIIGPGYITIFKLMAHPLSPIRKKRRVMLSRQRNPQISYIQTIGEIIKPIQLAMPIPLKIPVTVQANVNADTRNLTPIRDKVQIYGSSLVPLATSACGRAQVEISGHGFHESLEDVTANQAILYTTTRDVSALPRFSFAVYNFGTHQAFVQAELSPDGIHWASEGTQQTVEAKTLIIVTPENFLRYIRLSYGAESLTTLRIWVQAQN